MTPTLSHRLILPSDANHHGTLYAGSLLRLTLEAAYATTWRHVGADANLVLRRVLNLECLRPVRVGTVVELQGLVIHQTQAYLVTGLFGTPLEGEPKPWMEALLGFAHVDESGRPTPLPSHPDLVIPDDQQWQRLHARLARLLKVR